MKALIIGTDFLKDSDGNLRIIETNTNVGIHNEMTPSLDWVSFKQFLIDNSLSKLHFIYTEGNLIANDELVNQFDTTTPNISMEDKMREIMVELGGTYEAHIVAKNSITVPFIEDAEDTLIIRTSYDTTAIVDEEYTKDKVNFHRLISGKEYSTKIYYHSDTDTSLNVDNLTELHLTDGDAPNYVIKTRAPHTTDYINYPKFYKVASLEDLESLKSSLTDSEFMEEYHLNNQNFINGKIGAIRSLDILYGPTLSCLHLGSYMATSPIKNNEWGTTYNETGLMSQESRLLWMTKGPHYRKIMTGYILDDDTPIIYADGSLKYPNEILVDDEVKTVLLPWIPENEADENGNPLYLSGINSGSFASDLNTFTIGSSSVVGLGSETKEALMIRVTLENGIVYEDLPNSDMMIEEYDTLRTTFKYTNRFRVNDSIVFFDYNNNTLVKSKITELQVVYVTRVIYELNVEANDIFLPIADSDLGLSFIQHNPGGCQWYCGPGSCIYWTCSGCIFCDQKSDISFKENLNLIGKSPLGINIYQFNYIGEEGLYEGIIAQELIGTEYESALSLNEEGKYLVDYNKIDVEFKKID
jgi:hypothetical protein